MKSQRMKPSPITDMNMEEWFFLSGKPLQRGETIGSTVRHIDCSESAGAVHVNTRGPNGPEIVRRTLESMPKLAPLELRAGYHGFTERAPGEFHHPTSRPVYRPRASVVGLAVAILIAILLIGFAGCSQRAAENPSGKGDKITVQLPGGTIAKWSGIDPENIHYNSYGIWFRGLDGTIHTFVNCPVMVEQE